MSIVGGEREVDEIWKIIGVGKIGSQAIFENGLHSACILKAWFGI